LTPQYWGLFSLSIIILYYRLDLDYSLKNGAGQLA
jgi:hypothetical protein